MKAPEGSAGQPARPRTLFRAIRSAYHEFLALPTLVIAGFLLLALITYSLDSRSGADSDALRVALQQRFFERVETTESILTVVAGGLFTVTSIIVTMLLITVQQSASTMSPDVSDQFLRRRANQFYFGFFVGLGLFATLTMATTHEHFNPVYGGTLAILLSSVALYLLIILLFTTINQMRPAVIIEAISGHAVRAWEHQQPLLRCPDHAPENEERQPAVSLNRGYVTRIDLARMEKALAEHPRAWVVLHVAIGTFVNSGQTVAEYGGSDSVREAVLASIFVDQQRDLLTDAAYGVEQIELITWTSISSAKSNPGPGFVGIRAIRQLLAQWSESQQKAEQERELSALRIVYRDDAYPSLFDALESAAVAAQESHQQQSVAELIQSLQAVYDVIPPGWRERADEVIVRITRVMRGEVFTVRLMRTFRDLETVLRRRGRHTVASRVAAALHDAQQRLDEQEDSDGC